jgi:hypothetical protein
MLQAVSILYKTKLPLLLVSSAAGPTPLACASPMSLVLARCGFAFGNIILSYHPPARHPPPHHPPPRHTHPDHATRPCVARQVFNKVDVTRHGFALTWMDDFDAYATALEADSSYAATLSRCARARGLRPASLPACSDAFAYQHPPCFCLPSACLRLCIFSLNQRPGALRALLHGLGPRRASCPAHAPCSSL